MWLRIHEGETIQAIIDFSSIKTVVKHWTGQRSELCLGQGCPYCLAKNPKRWRYQAKLIVDGKNVDWEFGEQVMRDLSSIPHDISWARITITRLGEARGTAYQIAPQSEVKQAQLETELLTGQESEEQQEPLPIANKYTRGKYGHRVEY